MKILAAVDGSVESLHAAAVAVALAQNSAGDVTLVHATPSFAAVAEWNAGFPDPTLDLSVAGEAVLNDVKERLGDLGVTVKTVQRVGHAAEVIAQVAQEEAFEMVVVGSHHRGAIARWVLGSVTDQLVHSCKVPVLVVT